MVESVEVRDYRQLDFLRVWFGGNALSLHIYSGNAMRRKNAGRCWKAMVCFYLLRQCENLKLHACRVDKDGGCQSKKT